MTVHSTCCCFMPVKWCLSCVHTGSFLPIPGFCESLWIWHSRSVDTVIKQHSAIFPDRVFFLYACYGSLHGLGQKLCFLFTEQSIEYGALVEKTRWCDQSQPLQLWLILSASFQTVLHFHLMIRTLCWLKINPKIMLHSMIIISLPMHYF